MEAAITEYPSKNVKKLDSNGFQCTATPWQIFGEKCSKKWLYLDAGRCSHFPPFFFSRWRGWPYDVTCRLGLALARRHDWALGEELFGCAKLDPAALNLKVPNSSERLFPNIIERSQRSKIASYRFHLSDEISQWLLPLSAPFGRLCNGSQRQARPVSLPIFCIFL